MVKWFCSFKKKSAFLVDKSGTNHHCDYLLYLCGGENYPVYLSISYPEFVNMFLTIEVYSF
uniref:Uncharacterized protein n=1 Tax=Anguilla anguilla TaxID=7936 RepID=A0A0E9PFA0_ANGAN